MTAYLFAWNPAQGRPASLADAVDELEQQGSAILSWRSGNRRSLPANSRAFLIRLGEEPRGIVGAGWTRTEPDEEPSVRIEFDKLSERPVVPFEDLEADPFATFRWSIQASGVALPDEVASRLEERLGAPTGPPLPSRLYAMSNAPTTAEYLRALQALEGRVTQQQRRLFQAHYSAPGMTTTSKDLAAAVGLTSHATVNSAYGRLGRSVCEFLEIKPSLRPTSTYRWWSVWSTGWTTPRGFVWRMLPQVAEALEQLGWVTPEPFASPDEVSAGNPLVEGAVSQILVNAYERNAAARKACIAHHGRACHVCGFAFGEAYGDMADGYIHVHHVTPLSEVRTEYVVDPIRDLRPVCANCHAVVHLRSPPYSIDEVRSFLRCNPRPSPPVSLTLTRSWLGPRREHGVRIGKVPDGA